ncbi:Protein of uncharacterised function (DUF2857) [Citrobacter koseri]|nr:Protein of uncharacterised function (DUF2857) [Citrobacter koseri]
MTPSVNQAVLTHIVQALKEGQIRYCESLGFSPQELCELTRLTADDILFLSNSAVQFITTHIDHEMLGRMLARMEQERLFQQRLEEALSLGASIEFINHYFGLSTPEVCARRRLIGLFVRQGRNNAPDEQMETLVWNEWQKNRREQARLTRSADRHDGNGPRTRSVADGHLEPAAPVDSGEAAA